MTTESTTARMIRISLGAILLLLTMTPVFRLLDDPSTGLAGRVTVQLAEIFFDLSWTGVALILPVALLGSLLLKPSTVSRWAKRTVEMLNTVTWPMWVLIWASVGAGLTAAFSLVALDGKPNQVDAFAQMLHARYWASGMLAGPDATLGEFWAIQNSLFTDSGWVSQYPPGHIALLALFLVIGVPWLLGPMLAFVTIVGTGAIAKRLYPTDTIVRRGAVALLAVSPFYILLNGTYMNHATTAAFTVVGTYALIRAWHGNPRWALLAGITFAISLATRPLSTLAIGLAVAVLLPLLWRGSIRHLLQCAVYALAGAAPIVLAWLAYNAHFFGSPFTMGYNVALGPAMSLGFHRDPWGNEYGLSEAVAYTSSDLVALGTHLFESPLSATLLIGFFLLSAGHLRKGTWLVIGIVFAQIAANGLYWHHGIFMGPRMLHETAPFWVLLFLVAVVGLIRRMPASNARGGRYSMRGGFFAAVVAAMLVGLIYMAPQRAQSYGGGWMAIARTPIPEFDRPTILFVHDAWPARVATNLSANGMRLDLAETLLRQNSTCLVHHYADARASADSADSQRLFQHLDTMALAERAMPHNTGIRMRSGERLTAECRRQVYSDREGVTDITPLLWQTDLHGDPATSGILIARDLGPQKNPALLAAYPERQAYVFVQANLGDPPRVLPYESAMEWLWGSDGRQN